MTPFLLNASSNQRETSPVCYIPAEETLQQRQIWPHLGLRTGDPLQPPNTHARQAASEHTQR